MDAGQTGLLLDKDGTEVSSFGTSLPMFGALQDPVREVVILLGGPRGIEAEAEGFRRTPQEAESILSQTPALLPTLKELERITRIFTGEARTGEGFSRGLMKIRLPGGLHHSCVALNDLLSFHDKGPVESTAR